jgi:hypothetical protein
VVGITIVVVVVVVAAMVVDVVDVVAVTGGMWMILPTPGEAVADGHDVALVRLAQVSAVSDIPS